MPAFAPALLVPRSPARCFTPAKTQGNKITAVSFLETYLCLSYWELLGQPPLPSSPAQRSASSKKLENEEQKAVSPICSRCHQGHRHPGPSRETPDPVTTSSHVRRALCTSQNTHTEAKRDAVEPPKGCSRAQPLCDSCQAGCIPPALPKGTPCFPLSEEEAALCAVPQPSILKALVPSAGPERFFC